jgi:hypothetical protein
MNALDQRLRDVMHATVDDWSPQFDPTRLTPGGHRPRRTATVGAIGASAVAAGVVGALVVGGVFDGSSAPPRLTLQATPAASTSAGAATSMSGAVVVTEADDGQTVGVRLGQEVRITPKQDSSCGSDMVAIKVGVDYDGVGLANGTFDGAPADGSRDGAFAFQPKRTGLYDLTVYIGKCRPGSSMVEATTPSWAVKLRVTN